MLFHYTAANKPLLKLNQEHSYSSHKEGRRYFKPLGLWVSVDGEQDWYRWCKSEGWAEDRLARRYKITPAASGNFMLLATPEAILEFTCEYEAGGLIGFPHRGMMINWPRLRTECDGIIIAPYQYCLRLHSYCSWYYGWDCASGCIWNINAIERFEEDLTWNG